MAGSFCCRFPCIIASSLEPSLHMSLPFNVRATWPSSIGFATLQRVAIIDELPSSTAPVRSRRGDRLRSLGSISIRGSTSQTNVANPSSSRTRASSTHRSSARNRDSSEPIREPTVDEIIPAEFSFSTDRESSRNQVTSLVKQKYRKRNDQVIPLTDLYGQSHKRFSYYEIARGTNNFEESNLIGKGSLGMVYKGSFANGVVVAVKVFNAQVEDAFKRFDSECKVLRNIRHRNLVKVISSCANLDFKALVLEYMPNGDLDYLLYSHNNFLDLVQRLKIMVDVASALEYLHQGHSLVVVHCDLKPSNILLDGDMVARVSDFGISKLLTAPDPES
uniref:non-specific serine/threonine protein kinase n=1 Tax=Nicotiana tabacum TaxID=4097 RepID=A0A1S4AFQ6_TOBAC|nr:PREDICTED: probable LRR receptor-like serine/threonine-protein kinase At3g47570 [Nicotiana tabacum]